MDKQMLSSLENWTCHTKSELQVFTLLHTTVSVVMKIPVNQHTTETLLLICITKTTDN